MRVLVIGSGGREHALSWKLAQECEVVCAPGNPGMEEDVPTRPVDTRDPSQVVDLASSVAAELVVIGPEDPLIAGLADDLRTAGFRVFGPGSHWARLEGSKAFSKDLMTRAGVPTARFETFSDPLPAREYATREYGEGRRLAVKANGAALGKGVRVADSLEEALDAIERMMVHREFGAAGETVVLEERLIGREFSLLTLIGDHNYVSLPVAQDHKRAFDGDLGPNTGGMGAYSPCPWVTPRMVSEVEQSMVQPIFEAVQASGRPYRGVLFTGVMVTSAGCFCLEYNVRFGDPEAQAVMMRLGSGFVEALSQAASGDFIVSPEVLDNVAVAVVVASGGYPATYRKGLPIEQVHRFTGSQVHKILPEQGKIFWAGVAGCNADLVTSGGRVATATAVRPSIAEAREGAYRLAEDVRFEGAFFRRDIGLQQESPSPL